MTKKALEGMEIKLFITLQEGDAEKLSRELKKLREFFNLAFELYAIPDYKDTDDLMAKVTSGAWNRYKEANTAA